MSKRIAKRGRVGEVLAGTWRIERRLGDGGMAAVYAACHVRNGGRVAVKVLHPESSRHPEIVRRFLREGYLANTVNDAGVVRVYDDGVTDDGCAFLIMDLLDGQSLETLRAARGGQLPVEEALPLIKQVLRVIAAAHAQGIAHRDVKPDNVFVTRDGQVKLLDFGIAGMARSATSCSMAATGVGWGTPHFMAPEQVAGTSKCGPRVDVWAVGVMFFTLVTGKYPFDIKRISDLLELHRTRPAKLDKLVFDCPTSVASVIDRALSYEANGRWADAGAMLLALEEAEVAAARLSTTLVLATVPRIVIEPARNPRPANVQATTRSSRAPMRRPTPAVQASLMSLTTRRHAALGFLLLSIATFLGCAVYSLRVTTESRIASE